MIKSGLFLTEPGSDITVFGNLFFDVEKLTNSAFKPNDN